VEYIAREIVVGKVFKMPGKSASKKRLYQREILVAV
jgi:hypothetical protein